MAKKKTDKTEGAEVAKTILDVTPNELQTKPVFCYNAAGEFTGTDIATESPLEQGVFLMPANCTDVPVNDFKDHSIRVFDSKKSAWAYKDNPADMPPPPLTDEEKAFKIRMDRATRLSLCDWTQLADAPLDAKTVAAWNKYRQALRDITKQKTFPTDVSWPDAPKS